MWPLTLTSLVLRHEYIHTEVQHRRKERSPLYALCTAFGSDITSERLPLYAVCTAFGSDITSERLPLYAVCTAFGSDITRERLPLCSVYSIWV